MKKTALSGAVIAFVLAAVPMATTASAAQTEPASVSSASTPSVAGAASYCRETHYYNGRYHRHARLICTHRDFDGNRGNHDGRFGNGNGNGRDGRFGNGNDNGNGRNGNGNGNGRQFPRGNGAG